VTRHVSFENMILNHEWGESGYRIPCKGILLWLRVAIQSDVTIECTGTCFPRIANSLFPIY
jgi:hypothetical protein